MSWQAYVDDHLMCEIDGNHLTSAAITGLDGTVWAQSPDFPQVLSLSFFFLFFYSYISIEFYAVSLILFIFGLIIFWLFCSIFL